MFECLFHSLSVSLSLSVSPGRVTNGSEAVANFAIDSDKRAREGKSKKQKRAAPKIGTTGRHTHTNCRNVVSKLSNFIVIKRESPLSAGNCESSCSTQIEAQSEALSLCDAQ